MRLRHDYYNYEIFMPNVQANRDYVIGVYQQQKSSESISFTSHCSNGINSSSVDAKLSDSV